MTPPPPPKPGAPKPGARPGLSNVERGHAVEMSGVVKWYSAEKGFGFVAVPNGSRDVFIHVTAVQRSGLPDLAEGQPVVVGVVQGPRGPEASFVRLD